MTLHLDLRHHPISALPTGGAPEVNRGNTETYWLKGGASWMVAQNHFGYDCKALHADNCGNWRWEDSAIRDTRIDNDE